MLGFLEKHMKAGGYLDALLIRFVWSKERCMKALDSYAREGNAPAAVRVLKRVRSVAPDHLLRPAWWGKSREKIRSGLAFLIRLEGLRPESIGRERLEQARSEFTLTLIKTMPRPQQPK